MELSELFKKTKQVEDRREKTMSPLFIANFVVALLILTILKAGLIVEDLNFKGDKINSLKILAKFPLFIGKDIFGAFLLSLFIVLIIYPLRKVLGQKISLILSSFIQLLHTLFGIISYYTSKAVGSPLDKSAIDLALLNEEKIVGEGSLLGTFLDSVLYYITPSSITLLSLCVIITLSLVLTSERWVGFIPGKTKNRGGILLSLCAFFTIFILPFLRNGEILGIRMLTYSLERSPFVEFLWSYTKPFFRTIFTKKFIFDDEFYYPLNSISNGDKNIYKNPLLLNPFGECPQIKKTNLLIVLLESVGGVYVYKENSPMPYLIKLGKEDGGVLFLHHYSHWPQTMKAFFTLLCSELPYPDYQPITEVNPLIPCKSIIETLKENGYTTSYFYSGDTGYERQMRFFKHRKLDFSFDMNNMPAGEGAWKYSWGIDEKVTINALLTWIDNVRKESPQKKFFSIYAMAVGHHPYTFPEKNIKCSNEYKDYTDVLNYIDTMLFELIEGLKKKGFLSDTLIVIVSDHGEAFGQHPGVFGHGVSVYEEEVFIPALFFGPQLNCVQEEINVPTGHIDISPTILGLLGIEVPFTMKGRNLTKESRKRIIIFGGRPPMEQVGLRDGRWKFIFTEETNSMELFDIEKDPYEKNNLFFSHRDLCFKYREYLLKWQEHGRNLIENYAKIIKETRQKEGVIKK